MAEKRRHNSLVRAAGFENTHAHHRCYYQNDSFCYLKNNNSQTEYDGTVRVNTNACKDLKFK